MDASCPARADKQQHGYGGGAGIGPQRRHQGQPVQSRHHHVADHQVGHVGADGLQRLLAVGDGVDAVAGATQQPGQVFAHVGVVVGDQYARHGVAVRNLDDGAVRGQRAWLARPRRSRVRCRRASSAVASCTYGSARPEAARVPAVDGDGVGGQMRGAERQANGEGGAGTFVAVGDDAAAVQADQLLHQCQPDPTALVGSRVCGLDAVKPFEQPRHLRGGHTDSGVGDGDYRVGVLTRRTATEMDAVEGELQRIGQQVEDHLLPHVAVDVHRFVHRSDSRR